MTLLAQLPVGASTGDYLAGPTAVAAALVLAVFLALLIAWWNGGRRG